MADRFIGYYFKHFNREHSVAFIPGISGSGAFIQVITNDCSYHFDFPEGKIKGDADICGNTFSKNGINISLPNMSGCIRYSALTPLCYDIMGPFRFFPMECRHRIVSMRHRLSGVLNIDNKIYDFTDGIGYIEGDSGISFPKRYIWMQANDFGDFSSFMLSLAEIPFLGFRFTGTIGILVCNGKEYRFATYLGACATLSDGHLTVDQGRRRLTVGILDKGNGHSLYSPEKGKMNGIIKETNNAVIEIRMTECGKTLYHQISNNAGLEIFGYRL